jgi:hypothetical protein
MNDEVLGIALIIVFVGAGILSGGSIFRDNQSMQEAIVGDQEISRGGQYEPSDSIGISPEGNIRSISRNVQTLSEAVQSYVEEKNASIYRDKVRIDRVNDPETFNEYIVLSTRLNRNETVPITGWKVRSIVTGSELVVGGAASIPYVDTRVNDPVNVRAGDRIFLYQGKSPIGTSFRTNFCMAYLEDRNRFTPSLSTWECPDLSESVYRPLTDACLDYIDTLPRCTTMRERNIPEDVSISCKNYVLQNANYNTCVEDYRNDPEFFQNDVRLYSNKPKIMWKEENDYLLLLDQFGNIVDSYEY